MKYTFVHPESKVEITHESEKQTIFVFGRNGSGKTSFTRSNCFDSKFVFNEDFINRNVYIVDSNGAKTDTNTKDGFSGLWIGEDIVLLQKKLQKLIFLKKEFDNFRIAEFDKIKSYYLDFNFTEQIARIKTQKVTYSLDENKSLSENYNEFKIKNEKIVFMSEIKTENDFKLKLESIKNNKTLSLLYEKIKSNPLLSFIFLENCPDEISEINVRIESLIQLKKDIEEGNQFVLSKGLNASQIRELNFNKIIEIQSKLKKCIICSNENINSEVEKWIHFLNSGSETQVNQLKTRLVEHQKCISWILENKEIFETVYPEIFNSILKLNEVIRLQLEKITKNEFEKLTFVNTEKFTEIHKIEKIILLINEYVLFRNFILLLFLNEFEVQIINLTSITKEEINKTLKNNAENYASSINKISELIGLGKMIELKPENRGDNPKYNFSIIGHPKISELSDGQKHKLALAIFLSFLQKSDLNNKTIVIDDPVVSMDTASYHYFKRYIITYIQSKIDLNNQNTKLIILTHNLDYLFVQTSNILGNSLLSEKMEIVRIGETEFEQISLELINMEDFTLFKRAIDSVSTLDEIKLLRNIILKIFRCIVDLRLKMQGIVSSENPSFEIKEIDISEESRKKLLVINKWLNENLRKPSFDCNTIYTALINLQLASQILGFFTPITEEKLMQISKIINEKINYKHHCIYFEILSRLEELVIKESENKMLTNYILHPRNSFTKSLVSLSLSEDI
ncbi:MAG TPA: AAA family ATPase [Paludibacter sp.]